MQRARREADDPETLFRAETDPLERRRLARGLGACCWPVSLRPDGVATPVRMFCCAATPPWAAFCEVHFDLAYGGAPQRQAVQG